MTTPEANLERAKLDVQMQQSRVDGARAALREGKLQALAVYNARVDELQRAVDREETQLRKEQTYVAEYERQLENPFEKRDP